MNPSDIRAFADAGGAWVATGETATGKFCGILATGGSVTVSGVTEVGKIVSLSTGFTVTDGLFIPGKFLTVTNASGDGELYCINDVIPGNRDVAVPTVA